MVRSDREKKILNSIMNMSVILVGVLTESMGSLSEAMMMGSSATYAPEVSEATRKKISELRKKIEAQFSERINEI